MISSTAERPVAARRSRLDLWIPRLIMGTAGAHLLLGAVHDHAQWLAIIGDGVWGSVAATDDVRSATLWFMVSGLGLLGLGMLARRSVRATGYTPPEVGWLLLAAGVPVALMQPASGGWLLIGIGALSLLNTTRTTKGKD